MPPNVRTFLGPKAARGEGTNNMKMEMKSRGSTIKIGILGRSQMFGHEDVLNNILGEGTSGNAYFELEVSAS